MIAPPVIQIVLGLYAALLAAGGVIGLLKAGSRPSLIAGLISSALTVLAFALSFSYPLAGLALGFLVALSLTFFFAARFFKSRKVMPSGMLAVLSLLVAFLTFLAMAG
ncbi:Transmembrane proteins 14C [Aquisphaera giovannonii]|uniref:Transmembrane proteins 14C n=1 Tax=Aquisphaera giovannonii TaxID=406548 RepID=A0A5B9VWQ0_9BACT|nr:TMEM14 family protein [Aquisphaera giovannonii]QEH32519.1 Transmembrane proteins 14C [Aquisphaera giovannonii]